jgi:hypothetical protein
VQDFLSYCRLVKCAKEAAGKPHGLSGKKIGNPQLKWAFSEAAVLFLCQNQPGQAYLAKLERKHGQGKALTVLAQKLARAVYYMLTREQAFSLKRFVTA